MRSEHLNGCVSGSLGTHAVGLGIAGIGTLELCLMTGTGHCRHGAGTGLPVDGGGFFIGTTETIPLVLCGVGFTGRAESAE